ncbi:MAG TPA: DNA-processing protein DprA [Candidatus Saccharimonadales bacterium]|nr:DNA-processing protein DprA [Candidatus Saccharimonadales bacterium]
MKINSFSTDYPEFLKIIQTIADPPKRLWYIGKLPENRAPTVAVVGTRKLSNYGREVAHHLCVELAKHGVIIVSGLALGIDAIAHRAALEAGGTTIAIMPGGLDGIYPRMHTGLARDILQQGGALISEYPPGMTPRKHHFIARNRLVSGISDALLVVEASAKSGTMHTASFALDQGRTVMAVPGNITNPVSEGCNNLIKRGALAVTSAQDILDELGLFAPAQTRLPLGSTPQETAVLQLILAGERNGDDLQRLSGLAPPLFSQTLTMLEISGTIRALGANRWALK